MRLSVLLLSLSLCLLMACQIPLEQKKDFQFGAELLGKSYEQLKDEFKIKPPVLGFNQERSLSVVPEPYWFEGLSFEVVFVFDKPGREGSLKAVENICRRIDEGQAQDQLARMLSRLNQAWGSPQAEPAAKPTRWVWQTPSFVGTLSIPEAESGIAWILEVHQKVSAPEPANKPLTTLGGWERALYGNTLASLGSIYNLGKVESSRLNNKPVALAQNEVNYLGHPFKVSFFFDRFTPQASLVGIDLYLLQDSERAAWEQKRNDMIATLTSMYGKPHARRDGHRHLWVWRDGEGSLTFTDASKGGRTTWLLAFRPPPGVVAPTPALSAPRNPQDIAGWGSARFGMSPAQVELLYVGQSPVLTRLAGSGYGFEQILSLNHLEFKVLFLFDRAQKPPRLTQVVLTRNASAHESAEQGQAMRRDLLNLLIAWYGAPSKDLLGNKEGGKVIWNRPSGSLEFHDLSAIKTWVLNFRVND